MLNMSIETYDHSQATAELFCKLEESEADLAAGVAPLDGEDVFRDLRTKYGYSAAQVNDHTAHCLRFGQHI